MKRISSSAHAGASAEPAARETSRGQSLVEFAVFVPVFLLLLIVAVDFGRVYMGSVNVNNMARIGANFAAQNANAWESPDNTSKAAKRARYAELMSADATQINCVLPSPLPAPVFNAYDFGSDVRVDISCTFRLLAPFLSSLVGDGAGNVTVTGSTIFSVRSGGINGLTIEGGVALGTPDPTVSPPPSPTPSPTPGPTPTPDPNASPSPTPEPTVTPEPVVLSFHGVPTSLDAFGGGPSGSEGENQIVGIPTLSITFHNTTTGTMTQCQWDFGDGTTSSSCGSTVNKSYSTRGTYHVTLTVNGQQLVRSGYVLVGCKVPALAGVRLNSATGSSGVWALSGFDANNISSLPGNGNYIIQYQSLAGGIVNPPGGCSGATIQVGP